MRREEWDFYTIQSFPGIADDYAATCFAQSMMLDDGWGTSTLSDFNTALTVKLLTDLSRLAGVLRGPSAHRRQEEGDQDHRRWRLPALSRRRAGPARFAEHGIPTEGGAGGLSVRLVCKPGKGVLARLGRNNGEFEMIIARCEVVEPQGAELERRIQECGIPLWPHAFVRVEGDIERLIEAWNNEYAVLGYGGQVAGDLAAFCDLTGIRVVSI